MGRYEGSWIQVLCSVLINTSLRLKECFFSISGVQNLLGLLKRQTSWKMVMPQRQVLFGDELTIFFYLLFQFIFIALKQ